MANDFFFTEYDSGNSNFFYAVTIPPPPTCDLGL